MTILSNSSATLELSTKDFDNIFLTTASFKVGDVDKSSKVEAVVLITSIIDLIAPTKSFSL